MECLRAQRPSKAVLNLPREGKLRARGLSYVLEPSQAPLTLCRPRGQVRWTTNHFINHCPAKVLPGDWWEIQAIHLTPSPALCAVQVALLFPPACSVCLSRQLSSWPVSRASRDSPLGSGAVEQALQDKFPSGGCSIGVTRNAARLWARWDMCRCPKWNL